MPEKTWEQSVVILYIKFMKLLALLRTGFCPTRNNRINQLTPPNWRGRFVNNQPSFLLKFIEKYLHSSAPDSARQEIIERFKQCLKKSSADLKTIKTVFNLSIFHEKKNLGTLHHQMPKSYKGNKASGTSNHQMLEILWKDTKWQFLSG